jgi:hypothetical protein
MFEIKNNWQNPYHLAQINPIFDGLLFGIKFVIDAI